MTRGIAVAVAVAVAGVASGAFAIDVVSPVEQATAGVGRMAWDLVRASGPGNAIVSPASVWDALAMTHAGARGETAAEMARVLGMPDDRAGAGPRAATVCEIPYEGNRLAMVVIVPDAVDGLGGVLAGLDGDSLAGGTDGAVRPRKVNLALPRWTARKSLGLNEALAALGMKQAFRQGVADFSGMDGARDLFVSAVVHEGFVEVTEEGTEAAAATGVVVATRAAVAPEEPLDVRADRPFAWAVVERGTRAILFAGVVADPR